jgi:soluble lytic murein transglycosylase-like protein
VKKFIHKHSSLLIGGILGGMLVFAGVLLMDKIWPNTSGAVRYDGSGVDIAWLPKTVVRFEKDITKQAQRYNVDPKLIAIIMTLESGGYTKADSGQARGLMQVTPYTGDDIARKFLHSKREKYDLFDPQTSIEFGAAYLSYLRTEFCDHTMNEDYCVELIAAGYNGGPGAANSLYKGSGLQDVQTATYSRNALNMWRERRAPKSPTYDRWLAAGGQSLVTAAENEQ